MGKLPCCFSHSETLKSFTPTDKVLPTLTFSDGSRAPITSQDIEQHNLWALISNIVSTCPYLKIAWVWGHFFSFPPVLWRWLHQVNIFLWFREGKSGNYMIRMQCVKNDTGLCPNVGILWTDLWLNRIMSFNLHRHNNYCKSLCNTKRALTHGVRTAQSWMFLKLHRFGTLFSKDIHQYSPNLSNSKHAYDQRTI